MPKLGQIITGAIILGITITGCGSEPNQPFTYEDKPSATEPTATETPEPVESEAQPTKTDPYERWLEAAPADAPELTKDEALARAYLGACQEWPPGTTDAILQEIYKEYVQCAE